MPRSYNVATTSNSLIEDLRDIPGFSDFLNAVHVCRPDVSDEVIARWWQKLPPLLQGYWALKSQRPPQGRLILFDITLGNCKVMTAILDSPHGDPTPTRTLGTIPLSSWK